MTGVTPSRLGMTAQPEEDGATPEENARIKAAFYGRYAPCVIGHDSGLYLEKLPLDDARQPGLHVRSTHGARLNDEQMIDDYAALVHSMGRQTRACYRNAFVIQTQAGIFGCWIPPAPPGMRAGRWIEAIALPMPLLRTRENPTRQRTKLWPSGWPF